MNANISLILTNSKDITSDFLCNQLVNAGVRHARFNTDEDCQKSQFIYKDGLPKIIWNNNTLSPDQITNVVLRRPKPIEIEGELDSTTRKHTALEWSEVIESFLTYIDDKHWINHPANNFKASHKLEQLSRAKRNGINVPPTIVTNNPSFAEEFLRAQSCGVIVKPLASGFIERESEHDDTIIYTNAFEKKHFDYLAKIRDCPVMFQCLIRKIFDVRVTVLDDIIIAVALLGKDQYGNQRLDIRRDNMSGVMYSVIDIPHSISNSIKILIRSYELRFAALDFGVTEEGVWYFFEINPNGQWGWLDLNANAGISNAFIRILGRK